MTEESDKIKLLIDYYGKMKGYPEKSYLKRFTEDFGLNYNQWSAYIGARQAVGIKIIQFLMEIFPDLNLNWLLKDDYNMFVSDDLAIVSEPDTKYSPEIVDELYRRVEALSHKMKEINKISKL